jgi:uncharacterized protein (TIGR02996 family)
MIDGSINAWVRRFVATHPGCVAQEIALRFATCDGKDRFGPRGAYPSSASRAVQTALQSLLKHGHAWALPPLERRQGRRFLALPGTPRDATERRFVELLLLNPRDAETVAVYADWLEEQGLLGKSRETDGSQHTDPREDRLSKPVDNPPYSGSGDIERALAHARRMLPLATSLVLIERVIWRGAPLGDGILYEGSVRYRSAPLAQFCAAADLETYVRAGVHKTEGPGRFRVTFADAKGRIFSRATMVLAETWDPNTAASPRPRVPATRRKHSRCGTVRCDLCSPLRCEKAP